MEFGETEPRWYQPWLWYDFYETVGSSLVHFVCVDTPSLLLFKHNVTEQRRWINETIGYSEADWIVVFGHHPMQSSGRLQNTYTTTSPPFYSSRCNYSIDVLIQVSRLSSCDTRRGSSDGRARSGCVFEWPRPQHATHTTTR